MHPLDIHWVYSLVSVVLVATFSLLGMIGLALGPRRVAQIVPSLVSLSAGALLGTAMGHLLPEAVDQVGSGPRLSGLLLAGFCTFFLLEKLMFLRAHHNGIPGLHIHDHSIHPDTAPPGTGGKPSASLCANVLLGGAVHSFIDGLAIATAYTARTQLGVIATIAVLLHEGPHHVGDVGLLIHSGIPVRRAVFLNMLASAPSALGALLVLVIGTRASGFTAALLPFTTANFLYIAGSTLVPELQQERGIRRSVQQVLLFFGGAFVMFLIGTLKDQ